MPRRNDDHRFHRTATYHQKDIETFRALVAKTASSHPEPMFIRLWRAPPEVVRIDYLDSQIPSADDYLIDPDYPIDSWLN